MKRAFFCLTLAILLLLTACVPQVPPAADPGTVPTTQPSERETVPPTEPETEPPTEAPTDPPLEPGDPVSLMGKDTESFRKGQTTFVRAEDFAQAFDLEITLQDGEILLAGEPVPLTAGLNRTDGSYVPVQSLARRLGLGVFVDQDRDGRTYVFPSASTDIPAGIQIPVMMYHAVSDDLWGIEELFISPSSLEEQLAYLTENGYDPIFFSDLPSLEQYDKPVILTFDDGYRDNYENLFPLLQKYRVKATVFMITGCIDTKRSLTTDQIREMSQSGLVSIQSHTVTHDYLDTCSEEKLISEMSESQLTITRITGIRPNVLCYPSGRHSGLVEEVAARYYDYALIMGPSGYVTGSDPYTIGRHYVSRYTDISQFAAMVSDAGERF